MVHYFAVGSVGQTVKLCPLDHDDNFTNDAFPPFKLTVLIGDEFAYLSSDAGAYVRREQPTDSGFE